MLDDDSAREMLILAGLTYRGSLDVDLLPDERHQRVLAQSLMSGLDTLAPVHGKWDLVWGPASSRAGGEFDSSAMYVVRHRQDRARYVIAVRGTNPVSLSDWLLGDLNVATSVPWPFDPDGAAVSTSTGFGLYSLLQLRGTAAIVVRDLMDQAAGGISTVLRGIARASNRSPKTLLEPVEALLTEFLADLAADASLPQRVGRRLGSSVRIHSEQLLPRTPSPAARTDGSTLFEFLCQEARQSAIPLDVTVTGHSKGGALAPALALWLKNTGTPRGDTTPGWDSTGASTVRCVTFAGPTPGNTAFATRIKQAFEGTHYRVVNTNDAATHVWQVKQLQEVPSLFGNRSVPLTQLFDAVASSVAGLDYVHVSEGVMAFAGETEPDRPLVAELIHQHLDAYCEHFGLRAQGIDALTFFLA